MNLDLAPPPSPRQLSAERAIQNFNNFYPTGFMDLARLRSPLQEHDYQKPKEPEIKATLFPRYNELQARFNSALVGHRMIELRQFPPIIQRVNSTLVMAGPFYGAIQYLGFCDDGLCRYQGNVLVQLAEPDMGPSLKPGILLQYVGLRTYTTVRGAPETVPEFREASSEEFPDVLRAHKELSEFKPNENEVETYVRPQWVEYQRQTAVWANKGLALESELLEARLKIVEKLVSARLGVKLIPVTLPGGTPVEAEVPDEILNVLPRILESNQRTTAGLVAALRAMGEAIQEEEPSANALQNSLLMYQYTRAWLQLTHSNCFSQKRAYFDSHLSPEQEPWDDLRCWAERFAIPQTTDQGTIEPSWWSGYSEANPPR